MINPNAPKKNRGVFQTKKLLASYSKENAMNAFITDEVPTFAIPEKYLVPTSDHLSAMAPIPPSRMFLINKSLKVYSEKYPDMPTYDASQGDGGASLPGVPADILERAASIQIDHGTAYDMPYGTDSFRKVVI